MRRNSIRLNERQFRSLIKDIVNEWIFFPPNGEDGDDSSNGMERDNEQGAEKAYEDEKWLVIVPKTPESAKYYSKATKWCTGDRDDLFNRYRDRGDLFININKNSGDKYQFHFESGEFRDAYDNEIEQPIADSIGMTDGLIDFYEERVGDKARVLTDGGDEEGYREGDDYANESYYRPRRRYWY